MNKANFTYFLNALVLFGALYISTSAFAENMTGDGGNGVLDKCQYLPLATNLSFPKKFGAKNTSVCVDIPVKVEKAKIVFNMDTLAMDKNGNSNGLKHMVLMGNFMKAQIKQGMLKPEDVSIIGILHGSALKWATKAGAESQKHFINSIFKLKKEGINIQLEACGAAMNGAGLTKKDIYTYDAKGNPDSKAMGRIYVNQGAFGREIYLQNHGYAYAEEGNEPRK